MTDVYVAMKRLRRRGGRRASVDGGRPKGATGAELEAQLGRLALAFPDRVTEVAHADASR